MQSTRNSFYQKTVAAGATVTGTAERVGRFNSISIVVYSTQAITATAMGGPTSTSLRIAKATSVAANTRTEMFVAAVDANFMLQLTNSGASAATVDVSTQFSRAFKLDNDELDTGAAAESTLQAVNAKTETTNSHLQTLLDVRGQPNAVADGSVMWRGVSYGHDTSGGQQRPLAVDSSGRLEVALIGQATSHASMHATTIDAGGAFTVSTGSINTEYVNGPVTMFGVCTGPMNWYVQASSDNVSWYTLAEQHRTMYIDSAESFSHTFTSGVKYHRLLFQNTSGMANSVTAFGSYKKNSTFA